MKAGYMSARQAAEYLGRTYKGFDEFVRRHGVPHERYGRDRLFTKDTLDQMVKAMARRPRGRHTTAVVLFALALASSASARPVHLAIGASLTADVADWATSLHAFHGGAVEANPLLASHPGVFTAEKLAITAGVAAGFWQLSKRHPKWAIGLAVANTLTKGLVARHNLSVVGR